MSELTKLEVGKTYVFKDGEAKEDWLSGYSANKQLHDSLYNNGFTLEYVYKDIQGEIGQRIVIGSDELKYFKLKEETMQQPKHIRPEDEVTITTTYGELAKVLILLAKANGKHRGNLFDVLRNLFGIKGACSDMIKGKLPTIDYVKVEQEWLAELFPEPTPVESPAQRKVRELREQAEELLAKARELEEEV